MYAHPRECVCVCAAYLYFTIAPWPNNSITNEILERNAFVLAHPTAHPIDKRLLGDSVNFQVRNNGAEVMLVQTFLRACYQSTISTGNMLQSFYFVSKLKSQTCVHGLYRNFPICGKAWPSVRFWRCQCPNLCTVLSTMTCPMVLTRVKLGFSLTTSAALLQQNRGNLTHRSLSQKQKTTQAFCSGRHAYKPYERQSVTAVRIHSKPADRNDWQTTASIFTKLGSRPTFPGTAGLNGKLKSPYAYHDHRYDYYAV